MSRAHMHVPAVLTRLLVAVISVYELRSVAGSLLAGGARAITHGAHPASFALLAALAVLLAQTGRGLRSHTAAPRRVAWRATIWLLGAALLLAGLAAAGCGAHCTSVLVAVLTGCCIVGSAVGASMALRRTPIPSAPVGPVAAAFGAPPGAPEPGRPGRPVRAGWSGRGPPQRLGLVAG